MKKTTPQKSLLFYLNSVKGQSPAIQSREGEVGDQPTSCYTAAPIWERVGKTTLLKYSQNLLKMAS